MSNHQRSFVPAKSKNALRVAPKTTNFNQLFYPSLTKIWSLTAREAAQLRTFRDQYRFKRSNIPQYIQIGTPFCLL